MAENYYYVLNAGKTQGEALNYTYANRGNAFPNTAFNKTSINPIIKNPGIPSSGFASGTSANFFEIRNAPIDIGGTVEPNISANADNGIVNRIIPTGVSITTYAQNKQESKSNRIRTYDKNATTVGYKLAGSEKPATFLFDEYDYFILINPEISGNDGTVSIRPHFAKIKEIISYDDYGDGLEFEPKYPTSIPVNTNFEIYKGPAKTNTNVIAVSYGLRGNTATSSSPIADKYDVSNVVSRPTWYFYEDRLITKNQLNYDTKYMLTSCRWWSDWTSFGGTATQDSDGIYHSATTINASLNNALYQGHTIWADVGGIKRNVGNLVTAHATDPVLDAVKYDIASTADILGGGTAPTIYYGRTIHQSIFMTENEYGTTISDLGGSNLDAMLIDKIRDKDTSKNYYDTNDSFTFDPTKWCLAFPNHKRSTFDRNNDHTSFNPTGSYVKNHANLQGAKRHLYYKDSNMKNNTIFGAIDVRVNYPKNKISQIASVKILDQTGTAHLKYKQDHTLKVRNSLYAGTLSEYKLPYTATTASNNTITLNQIIQEFDCRNDSFIKAGDILRIRDDLFIVSSIAAPDSTNLNQIITVNKTKKSTGSTFGNISSMPSHTKQDIYVRAWNGGLAGAIPIDTEAVYSSNNFQRLTINGNTISKSNSGVAATKLRMLSPEYVGKDIEVDYGDSVHSYLKLKNPITSDYVPSPTISHLYYLSGQFSLDEEIFNGTVEDVVSNNENGVVSYTITGRDRFSKLLENTVTTDLNHSNDIIHSSLVPMFNTYTSMTLSGSLLSTASSFTTSTSPVPVKKHDLVYTNSWEFVGEVLSVNSTTVNLTDVAYTTSTLSNGHVFKVINITSDKPFITLNKALFSNLKATNYTTDLSATGDKGLAFIDGEKIVYDASRNQTLSPLPYTSASGTYKEDKALGYDISDIKGIRDNDSNFALKLGDESNIIPNVISLHSPSSLNYYTVLGINEKSGNESLMAVAPTMPLVLGTIETNTSDTRFASENNAYIYLVNRNIPISGFIHRLQNKFTNLYGPKNTFKYHDLQESDGSDIFSKNKGNMLTSSNASYHESIYNKLRSQNLLGAAPAYGIKGDGSNVSSVVLSETMTPIEGSNIIDKEYDDTYNTLTGAYKYKGSDNVRFVPPREFPDISLSQINNYSLEIDNWGLQSTIHDNGARYLINVDPKVKNYEILSLGDVYPESMLRHNHIGYSTKDFTNYGMLLEGEKEKGNSVNHANYTGTLNEVSVKDSVYQTAQINSSTITSNQIKRFGVMRLVEATFDWHFNPVDAESMPKTSEIPNIPNFKYIRWTPFTDIDRDMSVDKEGGGGDLLLRFYTKNTSNEVDTTVQPNTAFYRASSGGLLAVYKGTSAVTLTGDTDGDWVNGDWLIYEDTDGARVRAYSIEAQKNTQNISGNQVLTHNFPGIMPFNIYADDKNGIDTLDTNSLKFTNMYLARGEIDKNYLGYEDSLTDNSTTFYTHNLWIPMISQVRSNNGGTTNRENFAISAFHDVAQWEKDDYWEDNSNSPPSYHHSSRLISALAHETFETGSGHAKAQEFLMGTGHPYDNCTVIFSDIKNSFASMTDKMINTSASIGLDTQAKFNAYNSGQSGRDQHSRNLLIKRRGTDAAILGTRTANRILSDSESYDNYSSGTYHASASGNDGGKLFNTQAFFKPHFDLSNITTSSLASIGIQRDADSDQLQFHMNDNSTHNWMAFMPNLKNHYIVSNETTTGALPSTSSTTLSSAVTNVAATTIPVLSTNGFPSSGTITVWGSYTYSVGGGSATVYAWEHISYTGKTSTSFTGCSRNTTGVTAGSSESAASWSLATGATVLCKSFDKEGVPKYIGKITSHLVSASSGKTLHTLNLDKPMDFTNNGYTYRLMRISDTTFDDTPEKIYFNKMFDTGLQYKTETENLLTGSTGRINSYQEHIYAMYLAVSTDVMNSNGFIERRTLAKANDIVTGGDFCVTDGKNTRRVTTTKDYTANIELSLDYSGKLTGSGIVSFGKVFLITTPSQLKVKPKRIYIGNTLSIGTDVTKAIETILEDNDIDIDNVERNLTYTNNIVASTSGTTITLNANANSNITVDDVIYNQDGKFIGKIATINNTNVTLAENDSGGADIYYSPVANDELTITSRKPFILNTKFVENDVYNAVNFLAEKNGLEYKYVGDKVKVKKLDDAGSARKYSLRYKDSSNLLSVDSNESLFDKANKVVVIGDNIKATTQIPDNKNLKVIKHIDPNIKHIKEAQIKAEQLLELHNTPSKKIKLTMQKEGFELMKPGDLITLNFPNHNIPPDDYVVFEIENAMSSVATITVGTYNKSIAERLNELAITQKTGLTSTFTQNVVLDTTTQFNFENVSILEESLKYQITTAQGGTLGFTNLIGFSTTMGIGTDVKETREIAL